MTQCLPDECLEEIEQIKLKVNLGLIAVGDFFDLNNGDRLIIHHEDVFIIVGNDGQKAYMTWRQYDKLFPEGNNGIFKS